MRVLIKGIEALTLECFVAAARAGVVDEVAAQRDMGRIGKEPTVRGALSERAAL